MKTKSLAIALFCLWMVGCGDEREPMMMEPPPATTLRTGAEVSFAEVYTATEYRIGLGQSREYLPRDLAANPNGELWVVQQMERDPAYDDETECTERAYAGAAPHDCFSLQGTTVAIREPGAAEPATEANGRATVVMDANALHFMRRPSGIAFGATEVRFGPGDPGAAEAGVTSEIVFPNTFATCHEHWTGNPTDMAAFIGPSLWTSDPSIYNGVNGTFEWSNGSHLDMLHATGYCMGIAHEAGNAYWLFNGELGTLDRYDFGAPHYQGHSDHGDGQIARYSLSATDSLSRLPYVPSNMEMQDGILYLADTGNGRVLRIDTTVAMTPSGTFRSPDPITADVFDAMSYSAILDSATLGALWGGAVEPSGLALMADGTLVVANHATGHISLFEVDGTHVRTIDTAMGPGIGGLTVVGDTIYFVQMTQRRIYRLDVIVPAPTPGA